MALSHSKFLTAGLLLSLSMPIMTSKPSAPATICMAQPTEVNADDIHQQIDAYLSMLAQHKEGTWRAPKGQTYEQAEKLLREEITQRALQLDQEQAYADVIGKLLPAGMIMDEDLLDGYDNACYRNLAAAPDAQGCQKYLELFPYGLHRQQVLDLRDQQVAESLPKTVEACNNFLAQNPNSPSAGKVKQMREQLAFKQLADTKEIAIVRSFINDYCITADCRQQAIAMLPRLAALPTASHAELEWARQQLNGSFGNTAEGKTAETIYQSIVTSEYYFKNRALHRLPQEVNTDDGEGTKVTQRYNAQGLLTDIEGNYKLIDGSKKESTVKINWTFNASSGWTAENERKLADGNWTDTTADATTTYENWRVRKLTYKDGTEDQVEYNDHGLIYKINRYEKGRFASNETYTYEYNADGDPTTTTIADDQNHKTQRIVTTYKYQ